MVKRERQALSKRASSKVATVRRRKVTRRQARVQAKKEARSRKVVPGSFRLVAQTVRLLRQYWKPLGAIMLVYLILSIVLASGLSGLNTNANTDNSTGLSQALSDFTSLVSSGSSSNELIQGLLIILQSLVIIWALRQLLAGESIKPKEAYYRSMTPLIPFLLVFFVIILQLLPMAIGVSLADLLLTSLLPGSQAAGFILALVFAVLTTLSAYMLSSSIFALYIVTLPDMQPRQALRSAKKLVQFRRWPLMRRILFLPIFILLVMALVTVPLIMFASVLVVPVFYALTVIAFLFAHTYLYSLYRGLLA